MDRYGRRPVAVGILVVIVLLFALFEYGELAHPLPGVCSQQYAATDFCRYSGGAAPGYGR